MKKTRHENRCYKCVWRHNYGQTGHDPYLCDFATLAAPLTRGGVPPEECTHFIEGRRIQSQKELERALGKLGIW